MPLINVSHLSKQFGAVKAVDDISFAVEEGQIVALLGSNGAGKTTTLSMLLGLTLPSAGSIHILGHDMARDRYKALAEMNFSSPYVDLPSSLTAHENLEVYGRLYNVRNLKTRIKELAEDLQLGEFLHRKYGTLSAGQKTRVALAKALLNRPRALLLDEPTASLDPDTADWVRQYLQRYHRDTGASLLMASHNLVEVERMADHVMIMNRGRIAASGTPAELLAQFSAATLEETFLRVVRQEATV
ncbi:MAG TPA: ABC transporter ATP-binding protein [Alphaproteobacteria bacterium]|nr:ABC transporter ATP-binding protein [Alphaproteobacteria bacterium]